MERVHCASCSYRRAEEAMLTPDKEDIKQTAQTLTTDEKGHCTLMKGSVHQKDTIIVNTYEPNNRTKKPRKQNKNG
jgi:hypothetical protein